MRGAIMKFEEALKKLEKIVSDMETGEISLDKSILKFEEGMKLVKFCGGKLEEVEKKIEMVMKDKKGKVKRELFHAGEKEESVPDDEDDSSDEEDDASGEEDDTEEELLF